MKVSFDFDDTLSCPEVQEYAKELVNAGIEVHIVTSRYESDGFWDFYALNNDLLKVAAEVGILATNIHFTNMRLKGEFFEQHSGFLWHLDDNDLEIRSINERTNVKAIKKTFAPEGKKNIANWLFECEKVIEENAENI